MHANNEYLVNTFVEAFLVILAKKFWKYYFSLPNKQ